MYGVGGWEGQRLKDSLAFENRKTLDVFASGKVRTGLIAPICFMSTQ